MSGSAAALRGRAGVTVFPSEANMLLVRVPDAARMFAAMKAREVLVKNVSALHPLLANCLRITVGTPDENQLDLGRLRRGIAGNQTMSDDPSRAPPMCSATPRKRRSASG